ncbi:MAG: hypothetical protein ACI4DU_03685 [Lachnospiraceae bacterium]
MRKQNTKRFAKKSFATVILSLLMLCVMLLPSFAVFAVDVDDDEYYYENPDTGYVAVIVDVGDFLWDYEADDLFDAMKPITEYCNVMYLTDDESSEGNSMNDTERHCKSYLREYFGNDSAVVYCCDWENDYIYVQGDAKDKISTSKAYSITDNVYRYSAAENYLKGGLIAFEQIQKVLEGRMIVEPMKYVCNAFVGIFIALLINYGIVSSKSKLKKVSVTEQMAGAIINISSGNVNPQFINETKTYSPRSSSSGGGHGGGGHGGGGHGGGHSH